MRIVRFSFKGEENYGVVESQRITSLPALANSENVSLPNSIQAFIANEDYKKIAEELFINAKPNNVKTASASLEEVQILAPIAFPPKILCLGWNYIDHAAERKVEPPKEPVVFMKPHTTIVGPGEKIVKRPFVKELDYEGELAVVIGKKAKDVQVAEAINYVFGYTLMNDVSARDFQFKDKQWTRGKGFDTFAPMGPYIVAQDQLLDTDNLSIRTWVNGELRQNGNTRDMIFDIPQIIYHLSRVMTLEPCDIISTGTPSGVAMGMKEPKWLQNGDTVKIEIEGIGKLENSIEER